MNKKYIALLFSLMAATAPSATLAKDQKTENKIAKKSNSVKWIIGGVVVLASVAAIGGFGCWIAKNKRVDQQHLLLDDQTNNIEETDSKTKNNGPQTTLEEHVMNSYQYTANSVNNLDSNQQYVD